MLRLFVAVQLPDEARRALGLVMREMATHPAGRHVRWVNLDQTHLTLKFLGESPETAVGAVGRALTSAARQVEPFTLALGEVGVFPDRRRPRVIWVGIDAGEHAVALRDLHGGLERELARLGYAADDRAFSPHLTLGRVRQGLRPAELSLVSELLDRSWPVAPTSFEVRSICLVASELRPTGAVHTRLVEARLVDP